METPQHPKIHADAERILWLNFGEYGKEVEVAAFAADGSRVLTVQEVGVARVWETGTGRLMGEIRPTSPLEGSDAAPTSYPFEVFIEAAALSPEGDLALLGLNDGTAGVYRVTDGARLSTLHDPGEAPAAGWSLVRAVRYSTDGTLSLVGFGGGAVGIWDRTGERRVDFLRPTEAVGIAEMPAGRDGLVSSLDISQDHRFIFAGTADITPLIWDRETREVVFSTREQNERVLELRLEGEAVVWATDGGTVWSAQPGEGAVKRLSTGEGWAEAAFSPDGATLLARTPAEVKRWTLDGREEVLASIQPPVGWNDDAQTLGFAPDGRLCYYPTSGTSLVVDTGAERIRIACNAAPEEPPPFPQAPGIVRELLRPSHARRFDEALVSRAGDLLVVRGDYPEVELWGLPSGECVGVLEHPEETHSVALSPDGCLLAVSTIHHISEESPYEIFVWSVSDRQLVARLPGHEHFIYRMEFGPRNEWLASVGHDRTVRIWSLQATAGGPRQVAAAERDDLDFWQLRVLSDATLILFRSTVLEVHRPGTKAPLEIPTPDAWGRVWAISPDERTVACSSVHQTVLVWSLEDGTLLQQYAAEIARPVSVPGAMAKEIEATAGALLWHGPGGPYLHQSDGPRGWVTPLVLSPDRRETVVPGRSGAARVSLSPPVRVVARLPLQGRLRASCIRPDRVLMLNSAGEVFVHRR